MELRAIKKNRISTLNIILLISSITIYLGIIYLFAFYKISF